MSIPDGMSGSFNGLDYLHYQSQRDLALKQEAEKQVKYLIVTRFDDNQLAYELLEMLGLVDETTRRIA